MKLSPCIACALLLCLVTYTGNVKALKTAPVVNESELAIRTYGIKINVEDMEKALAFYCGKLGFAVGDRSRYPEQVLLKSDDSTRLILNRVKRLARSSQTDTNLSFTLQVNNLDEAIGRMRSLGVEFGETAIRKEGVGNAIFIKDPFGRLISLMHQTIVKVEPFKEPRLYNFGFLVPDMEAARDFYSNKLGFVVRSEKYLPKDLPLGHSDKSFAFMLHYRPGVKAVKTTDSASAPFNTLVFQTENLEAAAKVLRERGVNILSKKPQRGAGGNYVKFEDPFGNVSELLETSRAGTYPRLKELYEGKRYFELRDALKRYRRSQSVELLFYRAVVSNKFNRLNSSIDYMQNYITLAERAGDRSLLKEGYEILANSYMKTYQYGKAADAYNVLLTKFRAELDEPEDYENSFRLRNALRLVPPQAITFRGASRVRSFKDKADLTNIALEINGHPISLAIDTGANLSSITSTNARKLGLKIIDASINVGGITGAKTKASLGVAEQLRVGNVTVHNVVFLVFEDPALYISPISFQLDGLIGFPVIEAFREITFTRGGEIYIPATSGRGREQNMCIDDLNPIIEGRFGGRKLSFLLDTGANKSDLYPLFFKAYEKKIKAQYPLTSARRAGIGSTNEVPAYKAENLVLTFSGKKAVFPEIKILTDYTNDDSHYFYGNLGQDLVSQFEQMTLNFNSMSITFK